MGKELTPQREENTPAKGTPEQVDDLTDIDPADFIDPEEFGFRRPHVHE
jgi:hypothetical protein